MVPYLTAGFPSEDASEAAVRAAIGAGADVVELGVPFSDPIADGPTIQRSSFRALEMGMTLEKVLGMLRRLREDQTTPVVLFTYLNPVLRFGVERFLAEAADAGADGVLLTDLQAGADPRVEGLVTDSPLDLIRLIAPTTAPERVPDVVSGGGGFVYYIGRTGVTGARSELRAELAGEVEALRSVVSLPVAVGFGISTPEQAAFVGRSADGVIVGSALIEAQEAGGAEGVSEFLSGLRAGMDQPPG